MRKSKEMSENFAKTVFLTVSDVVELRQYKNNSDQFEPIPRLKLPRFFNHRLSHAWANQHVIRNVNKNKLEKFHHSLIEFNLS